MKSRIRKYVSYLLLLVMSNGFFACQKDDSPEKETAVHYVSSQKITTNPASTARLTYSTVTASYLPAALLASQITYGNIVYKVVYQTEYKGQKINASGLVCIPDKAGEYPILCFQNGTNTMYANAPTKNYGDALFATLENMPSFGYIVVVPDYLGFGESEQVFHPYLHTESTVQSIVDLIRSVKEFTVQMKTAAQPTKDLFIMGYSQGGWATLALQKAIEQKYASEFNLKGSSCGAGPYNLAALNNYVLSQADYPMPYFLAYIMKAHRSVGDISNPYSDIFQAPYADRIDALFDGKHYGGEINAALTTKISQLLTPAYLTGSMTDPKFASVQSAFKANSVAAWNVSTPTRLYHADKDAYIPYSISEQMLADFRTAGVPASKMELVPIPGYDHPYGVIPFGVETLMWFSLIRQ